MSGERKIYPYHYPTDVLDLLSDMSFSKGKNLLVVGSASRREMLYAADYDVDEEVNVRSPRQAGKGFQQIVRRLLKRKQVMIGDIKAGLIPEWMPVEGHIENGKVIGFDAAKLKKRLKQLDSVLTPDQRGVRIPSSPTPVQFLQLQETFRMGVVRWTPRCVLQGFTILPDGRKYTLEEAVVSPSLFKLDATAYVEERFVELSIIYTFKQNGKTLNPTQEYSRNATAVRLREDIALLAAEGNYFKMAKRIFSLADLLGKSALLADLLPVFNSDLGRLYSIISDMETLKALYEQGYKPDRELVRKELDGFRVRFGNINLPGFKREQSIPSSATESNETFQKLLSKAKVILRKETEKILQSLHLLPLPPFLRM
jgi:hypothetical protein